MSHPEITEEAIAAEYDEQQFLDWWEAGIKAGWVSDGVCMTHNSVPMTAEEEAEFEDGYDPCIGIIRIWRGF